MAKMGLYRVTYRIMDKKMLAGEKQRSKTRYTYMDGYVYAKSRKKAIERTIHLLHDETISRSWERRHKDVKTLDFSRNGRIIYRDKHNNQIYVYYDFHATKTKAVKETGYKLSRLEARTLAEKEVSTYTPEYILNECENRGIRTRTKSGKPTMTMTGFTNRLVFLMAQEMLDRPSEYYYEKITME